MPKVKVLVKSFINGTIIAPETMTPEQCVVDYDGKIGSNLELVEEEKPRRRAKAESEEE